MSEITNEEVTPRQTLTDLFPYPTAGALPSSRTEEGLTLALESDNIDEVKAQLNHIWGHYQSLEFGIAAVTENVQALKEIVEEEGIKPEDHLEFASIFFVNAVLRASYGNAHQASMYKALGLTDSVPNALRNIYAFLDHSDPEREANEAEAIDLASGE